MRTPVRIGRSRARTRGGSGPDPMWRGRGRGLTRPSADTAACRGGHHAGVRSAAGAAAGDQPADPGAHRRAVARCHCDRAHVQPAQPAHRHGHRPGLSSGRARGGGGRAPGRLAHPQRGEGRRDWCRACRQGPGRRHGREDPAPGDRPETGGRDRCPCASDLPRLAGGGQCTDRVGGCRVGALTDPDAGPASRSVPKPMARLPVRLGSACGPGGPGDRLRPRHGRLGRRRPRCHRRRRCRALRHVRTANPGGAASRCTGQGGNGAGRA